MEGALPKGRTRLKMKSPLDLGFLDRVVDLLPRKTHRRLLKILIVQLFLGFLDLLGVALIGVVGALSIAGIQSQQPSNPIKELMNLVHLENLDFQSQVGILAGISATVFVGRTLFSLYFNKRILEVLSHEAQRLSTNQVSVVMRDSIILRDKLSTQQIVSNLTTGLDSLVIGYIGNLLMLASDLVILLVISAGLIVVNPVLAFFSLIYFLALAYLLHTVLSRKGKKFGRLHETLSISTSKLIYASVGAARELNVHGRSGYQAMKISEVRNRSISNLSNMAVLPNIGKYIMESSVIIGAVLLAGYQFLAQNAVGAISTLAIFIAAGSRVAPSVLRIQQGLLQISYHMGMSQSTLEMLENTSFTNSPEVSDPLEFSRNHEGFNPVVSLRNVEISYPEAKTPALKSINLDLSIGDKVAIVGPTGSGKSTLLDVILGMRSQDTGEVRISNENPAEAIKKWPGAISYVPQEIEIVPGTIRENLCLGYKSDEINETYLWSALEVANLARFVRESKFGLDTELGERGVSISGGQKQRLGIARALLTAPKLLILDEATSSLDGKTEYEISEAINALDESITVILVAHRLSTVREMSKVVYLAGGEMVATGNFEEIRKMVPDFDEQAELMGL
jgi:ABC-type multidrug transport system fused ATPase/permease subunit